MLACCKLNKSCWYILFARFKGFQLQLSFDVFHDLITVVTVEKFVFMQAKKTQI